MAIQKSLLENNKFPLLVSSDSGNENIIEWANTSKTEIRALLNQYGAILFRGFDINGIDDFEAFAAASTSGDWVPYLEATSPRDHVQGHTSTSTKYKNDRTIFFHNEKSYSGTWPYNLFFYCDVPPTEGGETPLSDCRAIYRDLPVEIREKFERKKLMYVRRFSNNMGIPWKKAFDVSNEKELEGYCKKNYIEDLTWNADGTPTLKYVRNTILEHPLTGDKCWFNHGTFFNVHSLEPEIKEFFLSNFGQDGLPYNTFYGDGEAIEEEVILTLRELYQKHSVLFPWKKKDVILIDNMLLAHGRQPFKGERNILVTMTEHIDYSSIKTF
ncbi:TauD/TfdA family dioxygenase [Gynuella sunshinyii]|uniref:Putative taurine catabolism dioxygenase n=1 Tax=Gynuella sunshinyii YC6258 TaxID=1445510 RepID=A0A0C5UZT6_9GAMM|nr:TauD/TfdA family dioxygenase [Gynuella sunshinyii]AJQ92805.1 putative taurine catabolism dioxygenase [Gynuella sunshinyii YC6258]